MKFVLDNHELYNSVSPALLMAGITHMNMQCALIHSVPIRPKNHVAYYESWRLIRTSKWLHNLLMSDLTKKS